VFDGLLPEPYNQQILQLLFILAHWHGLAKLRLHTDETLEVLDQTTIQLGAKFREFRDVTCAKFKTKELKREADARNRRAASSRAKAERRNQTSTLTCSATTTSCLSTATEPQATSFSTGGETQSQATNHAHPPQPCAPSPPIVTPPNHNPPGLLSNPVQTCSSPAKSATGRRFKKFNLNTYKHHALGDYVETIRRFGTTDSYSTEPVSILFECPLCFMSLIRTRVQGELEHRTPKARYKRTSRKAAIKQLTQIERRQERIRRIRLRLRTQAGETSTGGSDAATSPSARYHLGRTQNYPENIPLFLQKHAGDPAIKVAFSLNCETSF
jgi:hypothetical protein